MSNKEFANVSQVKGIQFCPDSQHKEVAMLTEWREVTPMELKFTIDSIADQQSDFIKQNECPICMGELFPDLTQETSIEDLLKMQGECEANKNRDVIKLGQC